MNATNASRLTRLVFSAFLFGAATLAPTAALAVCGDGIPERGEQCDDGNIANGDCCDSNCLFEDVESPCTDNNECTFDFCDGQGNCSSFPNQQAECSDNNPCTVGDFCNSDGFCTGQGTLEDGSFCANEEYCGGGGQCFFGFCFGDPADCTNAGGVCNVGTCNVETRRCEFTQKDDDTPCDNPNACTDPGVCKSGECQQPPTDCSAFADDCNEARCDVEAGGCFSVWKENGITCNDDNACTDAGTCDDGECLTTPTDCSEFADQCNDADCDVETGCFASPKANDTTCSDGQLCTFADVCTDGTCGGTPVDCSESGDACNFAFCNPQTGECDTTPVETPTFCDDGDPCTENDRCQAGLCIGQPKDCSNFTTACTTGVCGRSGECFAQPNEDGGECDDGDKCTLNDQCTSGECTGTPLDCSGESDQCNTGFCNGDTGGCESDPKEGSCNDGDPCTTGDTCSNGQCSGAPKDCSNLDTQCTEGICNARTGVCEAQDVDNGTTCSDGNLCTTGDLCTNGDCAGTPKDCSASGGNCTVGECNPDNGQCVGEPVDDGTTCNDANPCTTGDQCSNGQCAGTPKDCSNLDTQCTEGVCNSRTGACSAQNVDNGTTCSDGNLCTTGDQCTSGQCAGTPKDCSGSGGNCIVGECNPDTGQCVGEPAEDGTSCSDGNLCTTGDECASGQCGGTPVTCPPATAECQESFCNPGSGQCANRNTDNGTTCSDGSLCTTGDVCTSGTCGGTTTDCSNLDDACNTGACSTETGGCVKSPRENGTGCSDGNGCTAGDTCVSGTCTSGAPKDCSSLDAPCRSGICNAQTGDCEAVNADNGTTCNDGAFCTATDTCTNGVCIGTGDACPGTATCNGQCNEAGDTCNAVAGTTCESDGNPCTDDVCDGAGNCTNEANEGACDDGLFCTTGDHCADKQCVGDPACPQTSACGDTCDEESNACRSCGKPFSTTRCVVNAVFVLQGALGIRECELCMCDVDNDGEVLASDALRILRTCTALPTVLQCPSGAETATTTTTTAGGGCEAALHNQTFNEKYSCAQTNEGGDPFCADSNVPDVIRFTHMGDGFYEVRDVPDTGFVMTGLFDCTTFTWNASEPGEYSEGGVWTFDNTASSFTGQSAYVAEDLSYAGACNETGAKQPATPPDPGPVAPCE